MKEDSIVLRTARGFHLRKINSSSHTHMNSIIRIAKEVGADYFLEDFSSMEQLVAHAKSHGYKKNRDYVEIGAFKGNEFIEGNVILSRNFYNHLVSLMEISLIVSSNDKLKDRIQSKDFRMKVFESYYKNAPQCMAAQMRD